MKSSKWRFFRNISYRAGFVVVSKLLSLLIVPIIARYFGPESYGEYNYLFTLISYCTIAINFGFLVYGTRSVSQDNDDERTVSNILSARLFTGALSVIVIFLISLFNIFIREYFFIILLIVLAESFFIDFYFYGKKNILLPSIAHIISQSFYVISALILVYFKNDFKIFILFFAISRLLESAIMLFCYLKINSLTIRFSRAIFSSIFKVLLPLGFGNKISFFKGSIPTLIIPYMLNYEMLGYYSGFMKFSLLFNAAIQIILFPLGPFISENRENKNRKKYTQMFVIGLFIIGVLFSITAILFKDTLILLFLGESYSSISDFFVVGILTVLLINPLYLGLIVLINYLGGSDRVFFKGSLFSLIIAVLTIPLFTYFYGVNGAFYGNFLSSIFFVFYILSFLKRKSIL